MKWRKVRVQRGREGGGVGGGGRGWKVRCNEVHTHVHTLMNMNMCTELEGRAKGWKEELRAEVRDLFREAAVKSNFEMEQVSLTRSLSRARALLSLPLSHTLSFSLPPPHSLERARTDTLFLPPFLALFIHPPTHTHTHTHTRRPLGRMLTRYRWRHPSGRQSHSA